MVYLLARFEAELPSTAVLLTALASGMFTHLAGWVIRITRRPTNLLVRQQGFVGYPSYDGLLLGQVLPSIGSSASDSSEAALLPFTFRTLPSPRSTTRFTVCPLLQIPNVEQALQLLEELWRMACLVADSHLLPGEEARFVLANQHPSKQIRDALTTVGKGQLQSRKQLEAHGIGAAVRDAWEQRRDQMLPLMERATRGGSALMVGWQPAGRPTTGGSSEASGVAAVPCSTCLLPAVQQALALAGVACANPLCFQLSSSSGCGAEAALERLQRCRGCRVVDYCW